MRKHGGPPSRRDKHVTLAAISPPGVARGRFVGGQKSGLAGCKPPPLFTRGASSCSSQGRRQGEPWGASPRPSAPTYLPTYLPGPTGTAEPEVGGLHVQPGGRARRRLRPGAPAGARSRGPCGGLYPHDRQGATGGQTPRPPAPGPGEGHCPGGEAGGVAGSGAPCRPRAPAGGLDPSVPLATSLP